jgi:hypothetical protein
MPGFAPGHPLPTPQRNLVLASTLFTLERHMEIVVSVLAVLVGLACFYAIFRSGRKDLDKSDKPKQDKTAK